MTFGMYLPLPVILGHQPEEESIDLVIPDIFVINKEPPNVLDETGWRGTPLLIIKVTDARTATIDTTVKFDLYQRHGVPEYWVVQLQNGMSTSTPSKAANTLWLTSTRLATFPAGFFPN